MRMSPRPYSDNKYHQENTSRTSQGGFIFFRSGYDIHHTRNVASGFSLNTSNLLLAVLPLGRYFALQTIFQLRLRADDRLNALETSSRCFPIDTVASAGTLGVESFLVPIQMSIESLEPPHESMMTLVGGLDGEDSDGEFDETDRASK
jgi:hypothetical protein